LAVDNKVEDPLMTTIPISLSDDSLARLNDLAGKTGLAPEELLRRKVEQILAMPDEEFSAAASYLLQKNAELYRRLA
jgi:antitoxin FitA